MFKNKTSHLGGCVDGVKAQLGFVETDPYGRYGRFRETLGKGAMKTVYKAFDEVLAMEVAWNQVKLNEIFRSSVEFERLYCEVHLLQNLNHDSIIKFHASWIDVDRRTFNFITEMFTSGTLREYRQKYQRVDIRAIKNWARQILRGLAYLHGHDPPVIHRDLKCDNIFVNGHLGQVKIGDLGLAAILRASKQAHSVVGTPEFMAPELYEEDYNELVDIYSFGMCVLEMFTSEYPYVECSNPAQIYKKVTSGKLPEAFYRIQDAEAQRFVGKCLEIVSKRMPAKELLLDPFLACDEGELFPITKLPNQKLIPDGKVVDSYEGSSTDMYFTGSMNSEDDSIFLKVQISDKDGHNRNIYFRFDIFKDTATDVAMEMVKELEITDWEPLDIAEMIEEEISSLVPNWKDCVDSSKFHNHHSFSYQGEGDDDSNDGHPFYFNSSHCSSHASPPAFMNLVNAEDLLGNDDLSSNGSVNSFKYSPMDYFFGFDYDLSFRGEPLCNSRMTQNKSTRFCPTYCNDEHVNSWRACRSNQLRKISRIRSLVDVRSQLLHRSLVEEIKCRRLFKTTGAVEHIGFHEPGNHGS